MKGIADNVMALNIRSIKERGTEMLQLKKIRMLGVLVLGLFCCGACGDHLHQMYMAEDTENTRQDNSFEKTSVPSDCVGVISIPDEVFNEKVRKVLGELDGKERFDGDLRLADLNRITEIDYSNETSGALTWGVFDITGVHCMTNVTRLIFKNTEARCDEIEDISLLSGLTNLVELEVGINVDDLTPIAGLENLKKVSVQGDFDDLSPLSGLHNLTTLKIVGDGPVNISDLTPLSGLTNLTELELWSINEDEMVDLSPLATLVNLESFSFSAIRTTDVDLSVVTGMKSLVELNLYVGEIDSIYPLVRLMEEGGSLQTVTIGVPHFGCVSKVVDLEALAENGVIVEGVCD